MDKDSYNKLMDDFEKLIEQEKNAILLYQSRLFYFINQITSIKDYFLLNPQEIFLKLENKNTFVKKYEEFNKLINLPFNLFFKYGIFKNLLSENVLVFIEKLLKEIAILNQLENKIMLNEDVIVYRGINVENVEELHHVGHSSFISTSLSLDTALEFTSGGGYEVLFKLNLKAPLSILVSPYRIGLTYPSNLSPVDAAIKGIKPNVLKLLKDNMYHQKEIILFNQKINYEFISKKEINNIIVIEANVKGLELQEKR